MKETSMLLSNVDPKKGFGKWHVSLLHWQICLQTVISLSGQEKDSTRKMSCAFTQTFYY